MKKLTTNDAETRSVDVVSDNVDYLKDLFPEAFTEGETVVFRDSAFENDVAKTNLAAILEQRGLGNIRSL